MGSASVNTSTNSTTVHHTASVSATLSATTSTGLSTTAHASLATTATVDATISTSASVNIVTVANTADMVATSPVDTTAGNIAETIANSTANTVVASIPNISEPKIKYASAGWFERHIPNILRHIITPAKPYLQYHILAKLGPLVGPDQKQTTTLQVCWEVRARLTSDAISTLEHSA